MTRLQSPYSLVVGLVTMATCLAGCASTELPQPLAGSDVRFPFHVAVAPVRVKRTETKGESDLEIQLAIDPTLLRNALQRRLGEACFASVTLIGGEPTDPIELLAQRAIEQDADLLITPELEYDTGVTTRKNEKFYINLGLFFFAWPTCLWLNDREYLGSARLRGTIYDLSLVRAKAGALDRRSELSSVLSEFSQCTMDFFDRANSVLHYFPLAILLPPGFYAVDNERVGEQLNHSAIDVLCSDTARRLHDSKDDICSPSFLGPTQVASWRCVRRTPELVDFECTLSVASTAPTDQPESYQVAGNTKGSSGQALKRVPDPEPAVDGSGQQANQYVIHETIPADATAATVHFIFADRERRSRSYTFPIEAAPAQ